MGLTITVRNRVSNGFRLKYALTNTERKQLIKECGVNALVLFEYWLRLSSVGDQEFSDVGAADYFGWSEATAKRHRLRLINNGWFAAIKTRGKGTEVTVHYLGKLEVQKSGHAPKRTTPPEKTKINKPEGSLFALPANDDE